MPFARCATAPLMPTEPTFANQRSASAPSQVRYATRPASIVRTSPSSATRTASSKRVGMRYVRTKSMPVPIGIVASSTSLPATPLTTSFSVPSPPTATTRRAPESTAARASSIRWPERSERCVSPSSPSSAARWASSGQRLPVAPLSDAGLTRKTVCSVSGGDGERDPSHAVDRRSQLVVADACEDTLDHDVAHREQAARFDAAQRADREQRGGLHLDGEHAARRPALVLPLVRVVEEVTGDDRPDVHLLVELLGRVHRAVHERPGRGGAMRLVVDEVHRGRVGGDGRERDDQVAEGVMRLQAPARADAEELLAAELDQLLEDDRRTGATHPRALHGDRLPLERPGVAEQPALGVALDDAFQVRLGDVLGPQWVARQQDGLRVVTGLGANVDRHRARLYTTVET